MDGFFIDKLGNACDDDDENDEGDDGDEIESNEEEEEEENMDVQDIDLFDEPLENVRRAEAKEKKKNDFSLEDTYLVTNYKNVSEEMTDLSSDVDQILKKSSLQPGLEKQNRVPPQKGLKLLKLERKKLSKKTKGKEWFDMPRAEITKEVATDFKLLKMRSVLDRKHVYKKNDITTMPKYFQIGKVIEGPADFYSGRIPKTQRKKTLVDELLADAEFKKYQKQKFKEIMDVNRRRHKFKKKNNNNNNNNKNNNTKQKTKAKSKNTR